MYFASEELVKTKWLEFAPSAEYRKILSTLLRLQKKQKIRKWLADYSDAKVVRPVDQKWTIEEWGPAFFSAPHLHCVAIVNPKDVFGKISLDAIMRQINLVEHSVEVCFFDELEEATSWLTVRRDHEE